MENKNRPPLIVVAGPTAAGKSALAAELGRRIGGEVVSADAMQVYRYMDIGSAKVTREEMLGVPHHMIDVSDPKKPMDAARYEEMATVCIKDILSRSKIPILCGGTGFYIQAVTRQIDFGKSVDGQAHEDKAYRQELMGIAENAGNGALYRMLSACDPASAAAIHPNNIKRVVRALEYFHDTGEKISDHNREEAARESPYHLAFFVITDDRETLYQRIDRRVDFMFAAGLVDEVKYLKAMGLTRKDVSMQGIGYKEVLDFIDGKMDYEETVRIVKRNSRHYAKRQLTWFKREQDAVWLNRADFGGDSFRILAKILEILAAEKFIPEGIPGGPMPM